MKKFFCGIVKFLAVLAVLGAVVYAVVAYWDKIMELVCKVKGLLAGESDAGRGAGGPPGGEE